ncbi:MAG: GlsB/YeaQ/YmgE family stress response membrane protein [Rhodobacteraceae bacterium]|uniref:GlsB/YeaQ/YmgE family stress response membrane protein n=1 Tax=Tabrizicola sp. SY72 TaxID=2741673 RepID=UPI0015716905|nr:GlsB/YeaQ/YmgE family stress response membrane protein [Tabrizicola sp. SY72]MBL9057377.1 GlsB/YeaQ/YmgE family stress response membrane protein [Paracoccaceae bacterium]NTT86710.1 GlsB/YeaQ/YmgE family stress response membrane protein [Tabrizicola sp. SY72]
MGIVLLIIVGAAAGFLATRLMRWEADIPTTIVIGVAGALLGGFALRALLMMAGWMAGFVGAVMGALLLIWLWRRFAR